MSTFHIGLWVMHQDHVSRLSAWVSPFPALSAQLCVPVAFRLAAFASCSFPFPLRDSALLTVGLLAISTTRQTSLGLLCSACVRHNRRGCLLYCGDWVSIPVIRRPTGTVIPFIIVVAVSMTRRHAASSKVHLHSSVRFSPCPVASFGWKLPWTLPLAFHPAVTSDAERDWGQPRILGWKRLRFTQHKRLQVALTKSSAYRTTMGFSTEWPLAKPSFATLSIPCRATLASKGEITPP